MAGREREVTEMSPFPFRYLNKSSLVWLRESAGGEQCKPGGWCSILMIQQVHSKWLWAGSVWHPFWLLWCCHMAPCDNQRMLVATDRVRGFGTGISNLAEAICISNPSLASLKLYLSPPRVPAPITVIAVARKRYPTHHSPQWQR